MDRGFGAVFGTVVRRFLRRGLLACALVLGAATQLLLPMSAAAMAAAHARAAAGICSAAASGNTGAPLPAASAEHCAVCALAGGAALPPAPSPALQYPAEAAAAVGAWRSAASPVPPHLRPASHAPPFSR